MDFITEVKNYGTSLKRFKELYWTSNNTTSLSEFAKLDFINQIGHWLAYLEKENIGLNIGIIGYDLYVIEDNQELFPDVILHSEEYGVKYLKREVNPESTDKGILINYKRAIISALELINQLYGTTTTENK